MEGSSGYDESYFNAENLGLRVYYGANTTASYEMFRDITGRVTGSYSIDDYLNTADDRQDRTTMAGIGLSYSRLRYLIAAIDYRYRLRDSSETGNEYQENRLYFSITLKPVRDIYLKK